MSCARWSDSSCHTGWEEKVKDTETKDQLNRREDPGGKEVEHLEEGSLAMAYLTYAEAGNMRSAVRRRGF